MGGRHTMGRSQRCKKRCSYGSGKLNTDGCSPCIRHTLNTLHTLREYSECRVHFAPRVLRVLRYWRPKCCEYWEYEQYRRPKYREYFEYERYRPQSTSSTRTLDTLEVLCTSDVHRTYCEYCLHSGLCTAAYSSTRSVTNKP